MAGVRNVAGQQRPGVTEARDDVPAKSIVRLDPPLDPRTGGIGGLLGHVQRHRGHGPDEGAQLEEGPVLLERPGEVGRLVRRSEPAPRHQVRTRRDRGRRVDLQQSEMIHEIDQVGRPGGVEQLSPHRKLPRLVPVERRMPMPAGYWASRGRSRRGNAGAAPIGSGSVQQAFEADLEARRPSANNGVQHR